MEKRCDTCGCEIKKRPRNSMAEFAMQRFCSHACHYKSKGLSLVCLSCGKTFNTTLCHADRRFCSTSCNDKSGEKNPNWKGGVQTSAHGYRMTKIVQLEGRGKYRPQHRLVMEQRIGRALKNVEAVHHVNGDKADNHPLNLLYFRRHSAHLRLHHFAKRHRVDISNFFFHQPWLTSI